MSTSGSFVPAAVPECSYAPRMTRAAALALRAAGGLRENCVVVLITDTPVIGNAGNTSVTEIELNPVSPTEFGTTARVHTTFAASAWKGVYDIDLGTAGSITELTDDFGNTAKDIDADSPTVHTQVPWHLGGLGPFPAPIFRDNLFEDAVLTGWDTLPASPNITGNIVKNTSLEVAVGAGPNLTLTDNLVEGPGVHRLGPVNFNSWTRSTIRNGTINWDNRQTLSDAQILDGASVTSVLGSVQMLTINRSVVDDAAIVNHQGTSGNVSIANSRIGESAQVQIEAAALKGFSITDSTLGGRALLRLQAGTVLKTLTISGGSDVRGNPGAADTIRMFGDTSLAISQSKLNLTRGLWLIDGPSTSSINVTGDIYGTTFTHGALAGTTFLGQVSTMIRALGGQIIHDGSGNLSLNRTETGIDSTIRLAAGTTGALSLDGTIVNGGTVAIDSGARSMSLFACNVWDDGEVINTGVGPSPAGPGDRLDNCFVEMRGKIYIQDTVAVANTAHALIGNRVRGAADDPLNGRITINGTSNGVRVDSNEILGGRMTLTDVPVGALGVATSMYGNHLDAGSLLTYTGGDAVAKQIRNNRVEGQSTLTLAALTGSAGGGLADVFDMYVRGQSAAGVSGARVAGQPVRNTTVEQGSSLNVAASGTVLQCRVAGGATLNTGAFRHSETEVSLSGVTTLTAANTNRLRNASFSDVI